MSSVFWRLPGPAGYIERIHNDLVDNRNVIVLLTGITPDGMLYELQNAVEQSGIAWRRLYEPPGHTPPANWLAEQCGEPLPPSATAIDFHSLQSAAGTTFILKNLPDDARLLQTWSEFVERYSQASRASENIWAPRLLIFWPSDGKHLPTSDLRLTVHPWEGAVDSVDLQLYAALLIRRTNQSPYIRNLIAALTAKLSGGDPVLCKYLCSCSFQELMAPKEILIKYALERGWDGSTVLSKGDGSLILIDGVKKEHPAIMAAQGKDRELISLIWSAQVSVLMPLLEERRQEIVGRMSDRLHLPQNVPSWQAVKDVRDLEIGIIWYQLHNFPAHMPRNLKEQINNLKKVRDDLSHRKVLSAEFLLEEGTIRALTKTV